MKRSWLMLVAVVLTVATSQPGCSSEEVTENSCSGSAAEIRLPKPRLSGESSVEQVLQKRRSVREFRDEPLTVAEIAQLLWAAQGVTSPQGQRTAPSAGARYPLELYLVAGKVTGLAAGVYHYLPASHTLQLVASGDQRRKLTQATKQMTFVQNAPASLLFSGIYQRTTGKYGERGVRYVHMDVGHAAENVYLQAVALKLGTVMVGGFEDAAVSKAACLPPAETPLAIMPVGRVAGSR
ncbi:MAG TPA: SagB/ThcOx family dehydrogenase [Geomonas sp.]|nr:SagB/ThcOx family dehydrogenase [Geomonas sp.]